MRLMGMNGYKPFESFVELESPVFLETTTTLPAGRGSTTFLV